MNVKLFISATVINSALTTFALVLFVSPIFIISPFTNTLNKFYIRKFENREKHQFPKLNLKNDFFSTQKHQEISDYVSDQIPFKPIISRYVNTLNYLGGQKRFSTVDIGNQNWLFYRPSYGEDWTNKSVEEAILKLKIFFANPIHSKVVFVVVPNKEQIYSEFISPPGISDFNKGLGAHKIYHNNIFLLSNTYNNIIDLFTTFNRLKKTSQYLLYNPLDTHYTSHSALILVKSIVERFEKKIWSNEDVQQNEYESGGDLINLLNIEPFWHPLYNNKLPIFSINRKSVFIKKIILNQKKSYPSPTFASEKIFSGHEEFEKYISSIGVWAPNVRYISNSNKARLIPGKTIFICDSFIMKSFSRQSFASYFSDVEFIHYANVNKQDLKQYIKDYDNIFFEVIERDSLGTINKLL